MEIIDNYSLIEKICGLFGYKFLAPAYQWKEYCLATYKGSILPYCPEKVCWIITEEFDIKIDINSEDFNSLSKLTQIYSYLCDHQTLKRIYAKRSELEQKYVQQAD